MRLEHPASRMREFVCPLDDCSEREPTKACMLQHLRVHGLSPLDENVRRIIHELRSVGCKNAVSLSGSQVDNDSKVTRFACYFSGTVLSISYLG